MTAPPFWRQRCEARLVSALATLRSLWLRRPRAYVDEDAHWSEDYVRWRLRHPFGSFADFYVEEEWARLEGGLQHPTLGARHAGAGAAPGVVHWLRSTGMTPQSRVADYGCGSLRIGRHLIEFLEPGHYWGLDITDRFFRDGLAQIEPGLVVAKQPNLKIIDRRTLRALAADPPDIVLVVGVLHHVPPHQLRAVAGRIAGIVGPQSVLYLWFLAGEESSQTGRWTFEHSQEAVQSAIAALGLQSELLNRQEKPARNDRSRAYSVVQLRLSRG